MEGCKLRKKVLIVFGTRPEAIKMAPLIKEFINYSNEFVTKTCVTAQHREMLDQVLEFFEINPDYDLDLMKPDQDLFSLTSDIILGMRSILSEYNPDFVCVHGDTTTSMAASIAAFYSGVKVLHIEAGLRTNNKISPFPEEINRQITGRIADFHFAPTQKARENLLRENIKPESIIITGNTVIDSLFYSTKRIENFINPEIEELKKIVNSKKKLILVTGHRRENHGQGLVNICQSLISIVASNTDVQVIYPVHLNPNVNETVNKILSSVENIFLIPPLSYPAFIWLMNNSYIIITDSGGIQEEAPSLGKPVLVIRDTTERPEAVEAGTVILVGTIKEKIISECNKLLRDEGSYRSMSGRHNPYGDGIACKKIVDFMKSL
jgi:UDP-N-acetylglucosamine 2-epimerase (non-hydrolysing)